MKKVTTIFALFFFVLLSFTSCQDEVTEITEPTEEETIQPNSNLSTQLRNTSSNDGSVDNIIDNSDCFSLSLPVTIVANGITITIESVEDYEIIEDIFEEFSDDEDAIEFLFPITVILNDYTEIVFETQEELEAYIDQCFSDDDVIECVDFVYPISFSIYNSDFQVVDTILIQNDEQLHDFIEDLDESNDGVILASLNFPVSLVYADGSTIEVNSNEELSDAINNAAIDCDDDYYNCSEQEVEYYLMECSWNVHAYNGDNDLDNLYLIFNANNELEILNGSTTQFIEGNWSTSTTDDGVIVSITNLTDFQNDLEGEWLVVECDDDDFVLIQETGTGTIEMILDQECENDLDCSAQEVSLNLQECSWYAGTNLFTIFVAEEFVFGDNGEVEIFNTESGNLTTTGYWSITATATGIYMNFEFSEEPYSLLNNMEWEVVDCESDRIEMENGDNYLVLEQDCSDDDPLGCLQANDIVMCDENNDGYEVFNLYEGLSDIDGCTVNDTVSVSYHTSLADAESNSNPIASVTSFTNVSNPQTVYVRIEVFNNPSEYEILEIGLYLEDCSSGNCNEQEIDAILLEDCTWNVVNFNGDDHLISYDIIFNGDGTMVLEEDGTTITAMWSTSMTADGTLLTFTGVALPDIQAISGTWLVVECQTGSLVLTNNAGDEMVMENDCN